MTNEEKNRILSEYQETKILVQEAEKRISELREKILQLGNGKHGEFVVLISEQERESFNLKEARKEVTPSVWAKISAFVKLSRFPVLKVERV